MANLYCSVTGLTSIISVTVSTSHAASTAVAIIETTQNYLAIADFIEISMGYVGSYAKIFSGWVKSVEYNVPNKVYTVTANDSLVQALDYFIVSSNPETPLSYKNIVAETLVENLMTLCGLTSFDHDDTFFTFGINNAFEINQVSVYDYCNTICNLLTWHLWCDKNGVVHFKNRKPYVMLDQWPENEQPGWATDTPIAYTWSDNKTMNIQHHYDEKNLRNRVVVYGTMNIFAEAKDESSPYFHYKTACLGAGELIDSQAFAQDTANYNLALFNRLTESIQATVEGDPTLLARSVVTVNSTKLGINQTYYIYNAEHSISSGGYTTSLELRR